MTSLSLANEYSGDTTETPGSLGQTGDRLSFILAVNRERASCTITLDASHTTFIWCTCLMQSLNFFWQEFEQNK